MRRARPGAAAPGIAAGAALPILAVLAVLAVLACAGPQDGGGDRFEVAEDLSPEHLAAGWESLRWEVRRAQLQAAGTGSPALERIAGEVSPDLAADPGVPCALEGFAAYRCTRDDPFEATFLPPFPPLVGAHPTLSWDEGDSSAWVLEGELVDPVAAWVPVDQVEGGGGLVETWHRLADSGEAFGCDERGSCLRLLPAFSAAGADEALALCEVAGPGADAIPLRCRPVAVTAGGRTFVQAQVRYLPIGGGPDFDFVLSVFFPAGDRNAEDFLAAAVRRIGDVPWSLEVNRYGNVVLASAARRLSPVLAGNKREKLALQVTALDESLEHPELGTVASLTLGCNTQIYVNDLNTSQPRDWHLPTPEQYERYRSRLQATLRDGLGDACPGLGVIDARRVVCDLPPRPDLETYF